MPSNQRHPRCARFGKLNAAGEQPDIWVLVTSHRRKVWEVIVEPDTGAKVLVGHLRIMPTVGAAFAPMGPIEIPLPT